MEHGVRERLPTSCRSLARRGTGAVGPFPSLAWLQRAGHGGTCPAGHRWAWHLDHRTHCHLVLRAEGEMGGEGRGAEGEKSEGEKANSYIMKLVGM